jgi:hypothetical protein
MTDGRPRFDRDLYTDAAIADPRPIYRAIRDLGPAVWLSAHDAGAAPGDGRTRPAHRDRRASIALNNVLRGCRGFRVSFRW